MKRSLLFLSSLAIAAVLITGCTTVVPETHGSATNTTTVVHDAPVQQPTSTTTTHSSEIRASY